MSRASAVLGIAASLLAGCATVGIEGSRVAQDPPLVAPIAFIIFKSSTPAGHSEALEENLAGELGRRGVASRFTLVPGSGVVKGAVVAKALAEVPSFVILAPSNGIPYINGVTDPESYDVRAYRILESPGPDEPASGPDGTILLREGRGRARLIWRGHVRSGGGFTPDKLPAVAARVVEKLVSDRVLTPTGAGATAPAATSAAH